VPASPEIFTIGHSTHPGERFLALLRVHGIELLADVRRYPGSRRHPQYNTEALAGALGNEGISYRPLGGPLGGRRSPRRGDRGAGASFRAYAEHMRTQEFADGLEELERLGRKLRTAVMCAEGDWHRCHRQLIADALQAHGWRVLHISPGGALEDHVRTPYAAEQRELLG
jgi:uncharacterized protein (DUF488 family)